MLLLNCAVLPYILIQHEAPAAEAGKVGKAERAVKCGRLRRVVRRQLDLPHAVESLEQSAQQGCADPAALPLRRDQNILNEHDRRAVADCADQPGQLAVLPRGRGSYAVLMRAMFDLPNGQILKNANGMSALRGGRGWLPIVVHGVGFLFGFSFFPYTLIVIALFGISLPQYLICYLLNGPIQKNIISPWERMQAQKET